MEISICLGCGAKPRAKDCGTASTLLWTCPNGWNFLPTRASVCLTDRWAQGQGEGKRQSLLRGSYRGVHHEHLHRDIYPGFNLTDLYLAFQLKSHIHLPIFPHFSNLFSYSFTECTILSPSSLRFCSVLSIALIFAGCFKLPLCSNFSWITISFILSPCFYLISLYFPTAYFCL